MDLISNLDFDNVDWEQLQDIAENNTYVQQAIDFIDVISHQLSGTNHSDEEI